LKKRVGWKRDGGKMKITITGRHLEVTPALRSWAEERIWRLQRYLSRVEDVGVALWVERFWHVAEVFVREGPFLFQAVGRSREMYGSIDRAVDKIKLQVKSHQGRLHHHRTEFHRRRPNRLNSQEEDVAR
jgi:putative sigma-54 modulation protein